MLRGCELGTNCDREMKGSECLGDHTLGGEEGTWDDGTIKNGESGAEGMDRDEG